MMNKKSYFIIFISFSLIILCRCVSNTSNNSNDKKLEEANLSLTDTIFLDLVYGMTTILNSKEIKSNQQDYNL